MSHFDNRIANILKRAGVGAKEAHTVAIDILAASKTSPNLFETIVSKLTPALSGEFEYERVRGGAALAIAACIMTDHTRYHEACSVMLEATGWKWKEIFVPETIREKLIGLLEELILDRTTAEVIIAEALPVIDSLTVGEGKSGYKIGWNEPSDTYPDRLYAVWLEVVRRVGLEWVDKHAPKAWYRDMLRP
jgi:hypothetical protein